MRRCLAAILVVGLVSLNTRDAAAQPTLQDVAAYSALVFTPIGSHSPLMAPQNASSFAVRYSHSTQEGTDGTNNLAASYFMPAGANAAIGGTVGYVMPACDGCDAVVNLGADVNSTLWSSTGGASLGLQGSLGWGTTDGLSALSAAIGVPLAISMEQANKSRFSAFVTPAFGWGRLSPEGLDSESGTRPIVGAGAAWQAAGGWGLHAAFQKVIIEDGGNNFGVGFSYKMGGK